MTYRGIDYSMRPVAPGVWCWSFQIGGLARMGRTHTMIGQMAIRRAQVQINKALSEAGRNVDIERQRAAGGIGVV
jgi:hypothetical protein